MIFSLYIFGFLYFQLFFYLSYFILQRKWYRNFLMKGFHIVVLLTAGPGIRDTQVDFPL